MTVRELKKILNQYDDNLKVEVRDEIGDFQPADCLDTDGSVEWRIIDNRYDECIPIEVLRIY